MNRLLARDDGDIDPALVLYDFDSMEDRLGHVKVRHLLYVEKHELECEQ